MFIERGVVWFVRVCVCVGVGVTRPCVCVYKRARGKTNNLIMWHRLSIMYDYCAGHTQRLDFAGEPSVCVYVLIKW